MGLGRNFTISLKAPVGISCRSLNANPRVNACIIALVISEHAFLKNWFIHLAINTKTSKFYSLIWMVLCFSMLPVRTTSCSDSYANFYGKLDLPPVFIFAKSSINVHLIALLSLWTKGGRTFSRCLINAFAVLSSSHRVPELWHRNLLQLDLSSL